MCALVTGFQTCSLPISIVLMDSLPACEIVAAAAQCFNIGISIESPGPPPPAPHARHPPGAGGAAAAGYRAWRRSPALFWPSLFFKRLSALPAALLDRQSSV